MPIGRWRSPTWISIARGAEPALYATLGVPSAMSPLVVRVETLAGSTNTTSSPETVGCARAAVLSPTRLST
jgi:hypothetical protein